MLLMLRMQLIINNDEVTKFPFQAKYVKNSNIYTCSLFLSENHSQR